MSKTWHEIKVELLKDPEVFKAYMREKTCSHTVAILELARDEIQLEASGDRPAELTYDDGIEAALKIIRSWIGNNNKVMRSKD